MANEERCYGTTLSIFTKIVNSNFIIATAHQNFYLQLNMNDLLQKILKIFDKAYLKTSLFKTVRSISIISLLRSKSSR